jgi:hypothetical protein
MNRFVYFLFFCILHNAVFSQKVKISQVGFGWANNSINTVVFRKNSLVTFRDTQYISYYNNEGFVVLGKRKAGSEKWQLKRTDCKGNMNDAHNTISIMIDGAGYLHICWDQHNNKLNYSRGIQPGSLELSHKMQMTGKLESSVSYPEFYKLTNGNLLFFYRDGGSGRGNLVVNYYDIKTQRWSQLHSNLIDGEGMRNAYWQACTDVKGTIHISWVWRETPDVASNHDMCYAKSTDGGKTWEKSTGEKYRLPITLASAEYVIKIPVNSELINQTSMSADDEGNPFIATYWRDSNRTVPQYHILYNSGKEWNSISLNFRSTAFSLSGFGSKRIPIARPQIMVKGSRNKASVLLVFRDEERGSKISVAQIDEIKRSKWKIADLTSTSVGYWEPTYDTELWKNTHILNLFLEKVEQVDAEGIADIPSQSVQVLQWKPKF